MSLKRCLKSFGDVCVAMAIVGLLLPLNALQASVMVSQRHSVVDNSAVAEEYTVLAHDGHEWTSLSITDFGTHYVLRNGSQETRVPADLVESIEVTNDRSVDDEVDLELEYTDAQGERQQVKIAGHVTDGGWFQGFATDREGRLILPAFKVPPQRDRVPSSPQIVIQITLVAAGATLVGALSVLLCHIAQTTSECGSDCGEACTEHGGSMAGYHQGLCGACTCHCVVTGGGGDGGGDDDDDDDDDCPGCIDYCDLPGAYCP